jgi:ATP-binding cassette subfamily C protein LapB
MANPEGVVAYVPNKGMLFEGTVMDNITMFEPGKELDAMNVAALLDLNKDVAKLPAGFQTKVNSMSNRIFPTSLIQRISLARALMRYPRILLLDRVNQAVDKDTEIVFQKLLSFLRGRTTLVLATNDPKYIKRADKAFHLHNDGALEPIARGSGGV